MRLAVLFYSAFRRPGALNISHETEDRRTTLCGREVNADAQIEEENRDNWRPDCLTCHRVLKSRNRDQNSG